MAVQVSNYSRAVAVTKSDETVLNCQGFFVGGNGNVAIIPLAGGDAVTLTGCVVGTVYAIGAQKIMSTNTTATNIVALY